MSDKKGKISGAVTTTTALILSALVLSMAMLAGWLSLNPYATAADYTYEPEIGMYAHIEYTWGEAMEPSTCAPIDPEERDDSFSVDVPLYIVKGESGGAMYTSSQPDGTTEPVQGGTYNWFSYLRDECAKKTCQTPKWDQVHNILVEMNVNFDKPNGIIHVQLIKVHPVDAANPNTENPLTIECTYDSGQVTTHNPTMISFNYPDASWGDSSETNFYIPPDSPSKLDVSRTKPTTHGSQNDHITIEFKPVINNQDFSLSCQPFSNDVKAGESVETSCTVTSLEGFSSIVDLTCQPSIDLITCGLTPNAVTVPSDGGVDSTLLASTDPEIQAGTYDVKVTGTAESQTHSTTIPINVIDNPCNNVEQYLPSNPILTYPIHGKTLKQVYSNFPFVHKGINTASETAWGIDDSGLKFDSSGKIKCDSTLLIGLTTQLPKWAEESKTCTKVQNEWQRFLVATGEHERGHRDLVHSYYDGLLAKIVGKTQQEADNIFAELGDQLQKASDNYDQQTGNGVGQKAVLNTKTACGGK